MKNEVVRKPTKQVGIRLGLDAFQQLESDARESGISPTSRARLIITDYLGIEDCVTARAPLRKLNPPVATSSMHDIVNALSNLMSVQMNLRSLVAYYKQQKAGASVRQEASVQIALARIQRDLSTVKKMVLEVTK